MTEVLQLNVLAGSRHDMKAVGNWNGVTMDRKKFCDICDNEVQSELYRLAADRGVEQRRVQTNKRNLGDILTALDIHNQNALFLHCRLHDVLYDSMA
jgi:hypothetical protein